MALWSSRPRGSRAASGSTLRAALYHVLSGDLAKAEVLLADAAREDSSAIELYLALAMVYRRRGEVGRAIHVHQNLLLRPELSSGLRREALYGLALDFRSGGFLKRATAAFLEVLESSPGDLDALRALEGIYVETGEWREAIAMRKRIGSGDPHSSSILAHLWTGWMRVQRTDGAFVDARRSFRRAVAADRRCSEPYVVMGDIRMDEHKPKKAIDLWTRALGLEPRARAVLYPRLHEAYEACGDAPGFFELMQKQRMEAPEDRVVSTWWAKASIQRGALEPALAELRRLLSEAPDYYPAYAEIGRALLRAGREGESIKAFELLIEHLPPAAALYVCRACGGRDSIMRWRCPRCGNWDSFA